MRLKEVRFRFQHENCWLLEATRRYPDITLVVSSVYQADQDIHVDLLAHSTTRARIEAAYRDWTQDARIRKISKLYEGPKGVRFHASYSSRNSIYPHIIHHTPISLGSISMAQGVEHYTILGEAADVQELIQTLRGEGTVDVESVRDLQQAPQEMPDTLPQSVLSALTDKQVQALRLAHEKGYYSWPRRVSAAELAQQLGLSSAAFLDHLRRAESKTLDAVVGSLRTLDPGRFGGGPAAVIRSRARKK